MSKHINRELGIDSGSDNEQEEVPNEEEQQRESSDNEEFFDASDIINEINYTEKSNVDKDYATVDSIFENIKTNQSLIRENEEVNSDCSGNSSETSFEKFESGSIRSTATSIHPDEIKKPGKSALLKVKRVLLPGHLRENTNTIKQSKGIWGYTD
ncbi:hypothetical protein NQ317_002432 [Molorchus minor]|uniref:Uncharacterized protein n=1 Tax=Molorchus minor TaxID=1323400 RepID=A0ABQ9IZA8_9CUCU|nr:hypothetical protein NQ317_002432 [Molorchus minor]